MGVVRRRRNTSAKTSTKTTFALVVFLVFASSAKPLLGKEVEDSRRRRIGGSWLNRVGVEKQKRLVGPVLRFISSDKLKENVILERGEMKSICSKLPTEEDEEDMLSPFGNCKKGIC
ncbi:hypothetical protein RJ641_004010 [Dillenia turbinata]|uniref:Uncharacterized protein n=1 Tax=Dillenia turbinata TaxID=194707 RepID=A0AAN8VHA8_9MAGN